MTAALARRQTHDRSVVQRAMAADPVFDHAPGWIMRLVLGSDLYVIARAVAGVEDGRSVIAGYPWFGDWGRDTMIALPGLTLADRPLRRCLQILETFARFVDRGMLPNVFPGAGAEPDYNTVDAALWYIEAWRGYLACTGDVAALERSFPVLAEIVDWHQRGTRFGIAVDPADGLLRAGEHGHQLTWMDATDRRPRGHPADRQARRDQRAVAQRTCRDGRVRRAARPAGASICRGGFRARAKASSVLSSRAAPGCSM